VEEPPVLVYTPAARGVGGLVEEAERVAEGEAEEEEGEEMDVDDGEEGIVDNVDEGIDEMEAAQDTAANAIVEPTKLLRL
jgi:hypothetical protein